MTGLPSFSRLDADFWSLEGSTSSPGAVLSPRPNRYETFAIVDASLLNRGWAEGVLDTNWYSEFGSLRQKTFKDGLDATSWGDLRQDFVIRNDEGRLLHVYDAPKDGQWAWVAIGTRPGRFRPAVAHLGRNRLVAFQVEEETGELWVSRHTDGRWTEWGPGVPGRLGAGLDAATLFEDDVAVGAQVVSRDERGRLVTTTFSALTSVVAPWTLVAPESTRVNEGQAAIVTYHTRAFDIFVSSSSGGLWRWSSNRQKEGFVSVGNSSGGAADLDGATWKFDGRWQMVILRRDIANGALSVAQLTED